MKVIVDKKQRKAKMRAHTATHLLHAELNKIIQDTKQAWSLVDEDYLRFDFTTKKALNNKEIENIERKINNIIYKNENVYVEKMNMDDALKKWAKAFFDEKYWEEVRVISIWEQWETSIELCWWTHVSNTSDIWAFKIVSQESVSSWIRRIIAYTWPKVSEYCNTQDKLLEEIAQELDCTSKQIKEKINKINSEISFYKSKYESIKEKTIQNELENLEWKSNDNFDLIWNISDKENLKNENFKEIVKSAKQTFEDKNVIIYNNDWNFAIICNKWNISAKNISQEIWLKWWWSDNLVQGKDTKIIWI